MQTSKYYPVVLFKVEKSLNLEDNRDPFEDISESLNKPEIADQLLSPYSRTIKSEFQGIFASGKDLLSHLFLIRALIYPQKAKFSIGIGPINSAINQVSAVIIEGKALNNAVKGLSKVEKLDSCVVIHGFSRTIDQLMNPTLALLWASTANWNLNRLKILNYKLQGASEASIADQLSISERAVYKNIREAKLHTWCELIRAVEDNISEALERHNNQT